MKTTQNTCITICAYLTGLSIVPDNVLTTNNNSFNVCWITFFVKIISDTFQSMQKTINAIIQVRQLRSLNSTDWCKLCLLAMLKI